MVSSTLVTNFFALEKQEFSIPAYKKVVKELETRNDFSFPVKEFSISTNNENNAKTKHWITFDEYEGFSKTEISSLECRYLTLWYIYTLIESKLKKLNIQYQIGDSFLNIINLIIDETELGKESICIIPKIQNKKHGILLDYRFFKNKEVSDTVGIQKKSLSLDMSGQSNKNYYKDKYMKIEKFVQIYFEKIFTPLDTTGLICVSNHLTNIQSYKLETKKYILGGEEQSNSQFQGIVKYGPYSKISGECLLGFIYRNAEKSLSHELYYALRGDRFSTFTGMEKMFGIKIKKDTVIGYGIDDYNEQEIEEMVNIMVEKSNGKKIVPIIIVPWDRNTAEKHQCKIYYSIKYSFLKRNISCQFVDVNKLKNYNIFKWLVSGIALQIFTKLGGSPWRLVPSIENCLIIGIGQAHRRNENNEIERYYSYSIQNDSSGLFRDIKLLSDNTDHDSYLNGLSNSLRKIISERITEFNCFVIHTPFRLKKDEMDTIRKVIELLAQETKKKFAVLRFNDNHHYHMGYDFGNNTLIPYESTFTKISSNEYLVWFEGLQYGYSSAKERIGPPVQISIDYQTTDQYGDIFKYLQDAVNLSGANWRGFNAKTIPVSILYARLLSSFISAFQEYQFSDINIENITPWFL